VNGRRQSTHSRAARVAATFALATGLLLLGGQPAAAHAELVQTDPGNGAHLDRAPREVLLRFSEPVRPVRDGLRLVDGSGRTVAQTAGQSGPAGASQIRMPLPDSLPDSAYVVVWRVLSADSHPVHGAFVFSVGAAQAAPVADAGARAGADGAVSVTFWLARLAGFVGLALLVGGAYFVLVCWPAGAADPRVRRLLRLAWGTSVVAAVLTLLLQGPNAVGTSLAGALDPGLLLDTAGTTFGVALLARLVLLAAVAVVFGREWHGWQPASRRRAWLVAALGVALAATWSGTGHAATGTLAVLSATADALHLLAMSVWLGGLALLAGITLRWRERHAPADAGAAVSRFSRTAAVAVAVLGATGLVQAWRELTEYGVGTRYFSILVFKVSAFGLLLWLGAVSRSLVQRRLAAPLPSGAGAVSGEVDTAASRDKSTAASRDKSTVTSRARMAPRRRQGTAARRDEQDALTRLRRSVQWEAAIATVVLGITAALVATPPGGRDDGPQAAAAEAPTGPYLAAVTLSGSSAGAGDVQVWLDPARPGRNQLVLNVRDNQGINRDVPEVRAQLRPAGAAQEPLPVTLARKASGQFVADAVIVPSAGTWQLELTVRTSDFDQATVQTQIPIRP
jgi:copper transport protein